MSEHKIPKPTTKLELTLRERLEIHGLVRAHKPADRDDERRWSRAWDAIDLDSVFERGEPTQDGRTIFKTTELAKARKYEVTAEHLDTLAKMPTAANVEQGRIIAPVRERIDAAREALKA